MIKDVLPFTKIYVTSESVLIHLTCIIWLLLQHVPKPWPRNSEVDVFENLLYEEG